MSGLSAWAWGGRGVLFWGFRGQEFVGSGLLHGGEGAKAHSSHGVGGGRAHCRGGFGLTAWGVGGAHCRGGLGSLHDGVGGGSQNVGWGGRGGILHERVIEDQSKYQPGRPTHELIPILG